MRLAPDLPPVNLAIRVRKPLDDALADAIHALRREGVRTSKVELIEMLLWESAGAGPEAVPGAAAGVPGVGAPRARRPPRREAPREPLKRLRPGRETRPERRAWCS